MNKNFAGSNLVCTSSQKKKNPNKINYMYIQVMHQNLFFKRELFKCVSG